MTDEKIIEVEVTAEDLEKMRAEGLDEADLPELGIKRYRPARHIIKNKVAVLLDADIAEHFQKRAEEENISSFQSRINQELRQIMEREKVESL
ncbi:MAG TPA: BrnA antitoxin family protein [Pyrinomonadaceae bacterium]|nr:BrnA antitoxin family protein [Pyrinomonadaceae bacterium]